jgi:hypothetical protein
MITDQYALILFILKVDNCGLLMFTVFVTRFILYFDILEDKQIENMLISDHIKPLDNCGFLMLTVFVTRFTLYFDILEELIKNMLIC